MSPFRLKSRFSTNTPSGRSAFRRRAFWRSTGSTRSLAFFLGLSTLSAAAVKADPPTVGGGSTSAVSSSLDSQNGLYTDIVFGRNVKGPYLLSWKGIRPGSDVITRDGVLLKRDTDYTFDAATGSLSFPNLLTPSQMVRIVYTADTIDSKPNTNTLSLPLQWTLWSQNRAKLSLNSLYKPDSNNANSTNTLLTNLQFVDTTPLGHIAHLNSGLFVDLHGGDWLARSGAKFAEDTKFRNVALGASYSYAGALFGQKDASGLTPGQEIMQANGTFAPFKNLKLTGLVRETNQLLDTSHLAAGAPTKGTQTLESVQALSLSLPEKGKIDASRGTTTVTDATGNSVTTTVDAVKVQRQLVSNTQATVGYEAQTIIPTSAIEGEQPSQGTYTQKTSVDVKSSPLKQLSVTGSFKSALGGANAGDSNSVHIEATPFASMKQLKITTGYEDIYQDTGVQRKREALVDLPPLAFGKTKLSGGVQQIDNVGKAQYVGIVNAKTNPFRYLQLDGGAKLRQGTLADNVTPDPEVVNTYKLKFALAPSKFFKLTGDVAHNPEGDGGTIQRLLKQTVGLESDWGLFLFRGQYGTETDYQVAKYNSLLTLGLDLRVTKWDTITTGFEGRSQFDSNLTSSNTYKLGFTHKLGSMFDLSLSGSYTQNLLNGIPTADKPELKTEAKVGVKF